MFEKFNLKQPDGSNSCGAYTLAALLSAWQRHRFDNKEAVDEIYREIGQYQKALPEPFYKAFIPDNHMSLPSSLIKTARKNGFTNNVIVYYRADLPVWLASLVAAEKTRIGEQASVVKRDASLKELTAEYGFYLLLVNNGVHWIVLSRHEQGVFIYDPAGETAAASWQEDELYFAKRSVDFSGVAIYFA